MSRVSCPPPCSLDRIVYLGVSSDHPAQLNILLALTRKFHLSPDVDLAQLVASCPFTYTGADFYAMASDAMLCALKRQIGEIDAKLEQINERRKEEETKEEEVRWR